MAKKVQPIVAPAKSSDTVHALTLYVLVFVCGAALMSLEMVGSRLLAPWFGSSIYVWGSLIGIFLGALSLGYFLGGRVADWRPSFAPLAVVVMAAGVTVLVICYSTAAVCGFLVDRGLSDRWGSLAGSIILFGIPSILLGMVSPYAVRLRAQSVATMGNIAGVLYALSTLGSIFGTFITAFLLIMVLGNRWIVISLALMLIGVSAVLLLVRNLARLEPLPIGKTGSFVVVGAVLWWFAPQQIYPFRTVASRGEIVIIEERDSAYQHIVVSEVRDPSSRNGGERRLQFDSYLQSAVFLDSLKTTALQSAAKYTDLLHLPLVFDRDIRHVLVIGGGGCVIPTVFHQSYPWMDIDVVEIDPVVVELATKYFGLRPDDQLRVHVADGRMFLRRSDRKYDLVILDAYTSAGRIPLHLMSKEFLELVRNHLSDRGMVLANIISAMRGPGGGFYLSAMHTTSDVFPRIYVFPKVLDDQLRQREHTNLILIMRRDANPLSKDEIVRRAEELALKGIVTIPTLVHYASWCQPDEQRQPEVLEAMIFTDDHNAADLLATK